jgi:poly(A) polymerase
MNYVDIIRDYSLKNNLEIYMVGGAVRDMALKKSPHDYDFALSGDCHSTAKGLASILQGSYVNMHDNVARLVVDGDILDFTNLRGNDIYEDLNGRDFTINSIALDLKTGEFIDPLGGLLDIKEEIISLSSDTALEEDPVRMLRAVRIMSRLKFNIDDRTLEKIRVSVPLLQKTAGERILDELYKIFEDDKSHEYIKLLEELNLLEEIFPIMEDMREIGWCKYHRVDALTHSLMTLEFLEKGMEKIYESQYGNLVRQHFKSEINGRERMYTVKLSCLLHDIGKPDAMKGEGEEVSFRGHDKTGEEELRKLSSRLPFSINQKSIIRDVILGHMRILSLFKQGATDRALYRIFRDFGENTLDVLICSLFDVTATRSLLEDNGEGEEYQIFIMDIIQRYFEYINRPKLLVTGRDVIELVGTEGSEIGKILKKVDEEIFYGNIKSREDALNFIKGFRG